MVLLRSLKLKCILSELNKKIKDTREKISQNTQKELNNFAKENPDLKQPTLENNKQELSR